MKKLTILLAALFMSGCTSYKLMQTPEDQEAQTQAYSTSARIDYKIQPQDRIMVTSYNHKDLIPTTINGRGILIDTNGYASMPLIHRVRLSGLTQTQAAVKLERLYSKFLKNPSFNVEAMNKRIYVLGEVRRPGSIKLDKDQITVLEAIAQSGDLTDTAVRDNIIILSRNSYGKMRMRKVDLTNFNSMQASNMILYPNDIVYVQPNNWKQVNVTANNLGAVTKVISNIATPYMVIKGL